MLVVDGVELIVLHQFQQMRKLHGDDAALAQKKLHAGDEVVQIGDMRQHVIAEQQVRLAKFGNQLACGLGPEELHNRRYAILDRDLGHIGGGFDAQNGHALRDKMLQQVTVVAGDLHHAAVSTDPEALAHQFAVLACVLYPAVRVG